LHEDFSPTRVNQGYLPKGDTQNRAIAQQAEAGNGLEVITEEFVL